MKTILRIGDRVTHRDGSGVNYGTVLVVSDGQWGPTSVQPRVRVQWDNGGESTHPTQSLRLVVIR